MKGVIPLRFYSCVILCKVVYSSLFNALEMFKIWNTISKELIDSLLVLNKLFDSAVDLWWFSFLMVQAVRLTKFDYRLSNQLTADLQKLRCRVNYHALKFTDSILEMGKRLVQRMRMKSKHFIALHLRWSTNNAFVKYFLTLWNSTVCYIVIMILVSSCQTTSNRVQFLTVWVRSNL